MVHGYSSFFNGAKNNNNSITILNLSELTKFENHPFKVTADSTMQELVDSIEKNGILNPILVRPVGNSYEIISGHRRVFAAQELKLKEAPCIIKEMSDDDAVIEMVDSNIYRSTILPSEKAWAYKMKYDALKHQGKKGIHTAEEIGKDFGDCGRQVQRYIKLTALIPELLQEIDAVPDKRLMVGVALANLSQDEQKILYKFLDDENKFPSLKQATIIQQMSVQKTFSVDVLSEIFSEATKSKNENYKITLEEKILKKFFSGKSKKEIEQELMEIVTEHFKKIGNTLY